MTYGFSTRTVGAPAGTQGPFFQGPVKRVVPLSMFFLDVERETGDGEVIHGYRRKDARKPSKGRDVDGTQTKGKGRGGREGGAQEPPRGGSGGSELSGGGETNKGQSTAPASEAVGVSPSRPGAPSKLGATRMQTGAMGSGNVAQYPVPIGPPLRRVWPDKDDRKRRKKKKRMNQEQRQQWATRLGSLCMS